MRTIQPGPRPWSATPTTTGSAPPPPVSSDQCTMMAQNSREHCGHDYHVQDCQRLARIAEAAGCGNQAKRSYDCGLESTRACHSAECCRSSMHACDDIDLAFENCLRGYCTDHGGNPDCATTFPPANP